MIFDKSAEWITDSGFAGLRPVNLLHKANLPPADLKHREDLKNRHILVRKVFTCDEAPQSAGILITADDYYKLYINGSFAGQGPAPTYHFNYNVNQYEISGLIKKGRNVIAVHVYYQGLVNRVWNSGDYRMGMIAQLFCGDKLLAVTDGSWKYTAAREFTGTETTGYDTQFIEDIDNRKKIKGWKAPDFNDDNWSYMSVNQGHDYQFSMQSTPPLQIYTAAPAHITLVSPKNHILDFGHEITGRLIVSAKGKSGDIVKLGYGEELESPEKVRSKMRCNCNYNETWTLSGENDELDQYDYKAFRYAQISADTAEIDISSVRAELRHYPFDDKLCEFESSNSLLNQIWEICKKAVKFGTQEAMLDCPSREKGQYLGDATTTAKSQAYLTGDYRMFKKCLTDFAQTSKICPGLMAVAPGSFMQEIADYSLQWPMQLLDYYTLSGDAGFLKEMLPIAEGIIGYFKQFCRADGLIENFKDKPVMVDWPSNLRDGYDYALMPEYQDGCNTVLNAFYVGALQTANKIKAALGIGYNENETQRLKTSFISAFYNRSSGLFADAEGSGHSSLHANALPLYFGLAPDDSSAIVSHIKQKRLSCGVYFAYFVLKSLVKAGEYDFVYELLSSQDEHSWGNMVKEGATTCFEAWGKEQKWNTSLCHPWASSPVIILIEDIIGIKSAEPGWKKVEFEPQIPAALDSFAFRLPVPQGEIQVERKEGKNTFVCRF